MTDTVAASVVEVVGPEASIDGGIAGSWIHSDAKDMRCVDLASIIVVSRSFGSKCKGTRHQIDSADLYEYGPLAVNKRPIR